MESVIPQTQLIGSNLVFNLGDKDNQIWHWYLGMVWQWNQWLDHV